MICETCHGQGLVQPGKAARSHGASGLLPCEECGGTGFDHCCDPKAYPDMACRAGGGKDETVVGLPGVPDNP